MEALTNDLKVRVQQVLEKRRLAQDASAAEATASWEEDRFVARARALFYARLMFLSIGLLILGVTRWSEYFGLGGPVAIAVYFTMLIYSVANFMIIDAPRAGRLVTYLTLCMDLVIMVVLIARPQEGGGLQSPLLATLLLFTMLFAILFPKPLAIMPPLLALPITTRLDLLLDRSVSAVELLTLLWYLALDFVVVYVIVYLNERETAAHREVVELQGDLKQLAVVEERNRLARDIHDGLGGSLSSLILQSEYLMQVTKEPELRQEISELKTTAEEAIEELRRSLRMMREDFELGQGLEEFLRNRREQVRLDIHYAQSGLARKLAPDLQLAIFRVVQECVSNAAKHAQAQNLWVKLAWEPGALLLSVKDDGRGFKMESSPAGHYGLRNMQERAGRFGGSLVIDSAPGQGTTVSLSLPVP
ncbi:MAG: hypothetical protein RL653_617 [Pseudomonadota bacterium]